MHVHIMLFSISETYNNFINTFLISINGLHFQCFFQEIKKELCMSTTVQYMACFYKLFTLHRPVIPKLLSRLVSFKTLYLTFRHVLLCTLSNSHSLMIRYIQLQINSHLRLYDKPYTPC